MRFIYKLLFGLIIFNACIMLFSGMFNYASVSDLDEDAVDVEDEYGDTYGNPGNLWSGIVSNLFSLPSIAALLIIFAGSGVVGKFTSGNYSLTLVTGIGLFIGLLSALWISTFQTITEITSSYGLLLNGLVSIITIVVGLLMVFSIIEMLVGQHGVNM